MAGKRAWWTSEEAEADSMTDEPSRRDKTVSITAKTLHSARAGSMTINPIHRVTGLSRVKTIKIEAELLRADDSFDEVIRRTAELNLKKP